MRLYRFYLIILLILTFFRTIAQKPDWIRISEIDDIFSSSAEARRIVAHPDGTIFVMGQYFGTITLNDQSITSPATQTLNDGFIARYNANGDVLWVKPVFQSQGYYSNRLLDMKVDDQGDLVFSGSCLWPSTILGSTQGVGPFIAKMDRDGNLKWLNFQPLAGGSIAEHDIGRRGNRIGFDADRNILWFTDQINEFAPSGGLAVMKFKPDGTTLGTMFVTRNPSFYRPYMRDFAVDAQGNFIISGNFEFTVNFAGGPGLYNNGSNTNPEQCFVAKFTNDGHFLWVVYTDQGSNYLTSHTVDAAGNVYVAWQLDVGSTIYTPYGNVPVTGNRQSIARISADGKLEWMNDVPAANVEDLVLAPDGLFYATGLSYSSEFRYQSYFHALSGEAAFVLKFNTDGNFFGAYFGNSVDDPSTEWGPLVYGYQSAIDATGNIYTVGYFYDKIVWNCVPAASSSGGFFLVKSMAAGSPIRSIAGPGQVCDGATITLSTNLISNGVLYAWFTPGNAPSAPTALNNSITFAASDAYNKQPVIVSITDNCDEYFAEPYVLNIPPKPEKPRFITSTDTVCANTSGEYLIDEGQDGDTYTWTLPQGISAPALTDHGGMLVFNAQFTAGDVKVSATNACGLAETILHIATYPDPVTPTIMTTDQELCPDMLTLQITAQPVTNALSYQWQLPPHIVFNPLYPAGGTTLYALADRDLVSAGISVRAVGHCNMSEASLPVQVRRAALPEDATTPEGDPEICTTQGVVRYSVLPILHASLYAWSVPDMFDKKGTVTTIQPYIDLQAKTTGTGEISVRGKNTCLTEGVPASLTVASDAPPDAPTLTLSACDARITVSGASNFSWYINGSAAPDVTGNELVLSDSGTYYVEAENFCGVRKSNMVEAYPVAASAVLIPNVITPNDDGKNDFFVIDRSLPDAEVTVVTRWGELIYSSPHYQNQWNASTVPAGSYFLTVRHPCLPQGYKGWLSVVK